MFRIFGYVVISEETYCSMANFINRLTEKNWRAERDNYLIKTIKELQERLEYAVIKHPDLKKDFEEHKNKQIEVI